jgi:hypothetical protein
VFGNQDSIGKMDEKVYDESNSDQGQCLQEHVNPERRLSKKIFHEKNQEISR